MIYVVIPVHNRKELTRDCLASLQKQDSDNHVTIVVDDGSTDGTSEMIRDTFPEVVLLHGHGNLWWIGSINKGIRYALSKCTSDDYILVLNDDLTVRTDYLSNLIKAANKRPSSIIGSVETTKETPNIIKSGGVRVNWKTAKWRRLHEGCSLDDFPPGYILEVSKLTGRGTLFPSKVFREVGLYDEEHFKQCGDPELPSRANFKFGFQLFVSYDAVVISKVSTQENINSKNQYRLTDLREYLFGIKSHFNLRDRYWFARNIAPNPFWFVRYFTLNVLRTIYHFLVRLKLT